MADERERLPEPAMRVVDELRRLEPPPTLLGEVLAEVAATPQRRPWPKVVRSLTGLALAGAAVLGAIAVLPRLGILGPAAGASASGLPGVELRLAVPDGAYPASADAASVWLGNDRSGRVTRVDAATGAISGEIQVNAATGDPYSLWPVTDGASVWAAGSDDRTVVRLDGGSLATLSRWPIDAVPYRIAPANDVVWVSDFDGNRVLVLDASDGRIRGSVDVERPTGIAVGETAVYVVGYEGDLLVLDPATREVIGRHAIATRATDVLAVDGGLLIWGIRDRELQRFDLVAVALGASLPGVTGVAILNGEPWAAIQGGTLSLLDGVSLARRATISLGDVQTDQLVAASDRLWAFAGTAGGTFLYAVRPGP